MFSPIKPPVSSDILVSADSRAFTVMVLLELTSAFDTADHSIQYLDQHCMIQGQFIRCGSRVVQRFSFGQDM